MKVTVDQDKVGLFIKLGKDGYVCRPHPTAFPTKLKVGETTTAYHFGGTKAVGVDKIEGQRGLYREYWMTSYSVEEAESYKLKYQNFDIFSGAAAIFAWNLNRNYFKGLK